jgi:hypothetical protein
VRLQVEDVVLVDERRDDQQRPCMHARLPRTVLDQLCDRILVDHRAFRDRQVAAHLEGTRLAHRQAADGEIVAQVVEARKQAAAAGFQGAPDGLGIGRGKVGRGKRYHLTQHEAQAPCVRGRELCRVEHLAQPACVEPVGRFEQAEEGQGAPLRGFEARIFVPALGDASRRRCVQHLRKQREPISVEAFLDFPQPLWTGRQRGEQLLQVELLRLREARDEVRDSAGRGPLQGL